MIPFCFAVWYPVLKAGIVRHSQTRKRRHDHEGCQKKFHEKDSRSIRSRSPAPGRGGRASVCRRQKQRLEAHRPVQAMEASCLIPWDQAAFLVSCGILQKGVGHMTIQQLHILLQPLINFLGEICLMLIALGGLSWAVVWIAKRIWRYVLAAGAILALAALILLYLG